MNVVTGEEPHRECILNTKESDWRCPSLRTPHRSSLAPPAWFWVRLHSSFPRYEYAENPSVQLTGPLSGSSPSPSQSTWLGVWNPGYLSKTCHLAGEGSWGSHVVISSCFFTWEDGEGIFSSILMIWRDMAHVPSLSFGNKPMCVYWHEFQSEKKKATFISPHWSPHSSRWHMWQELGHTHRPRPPPQSLGGSPSGPMSVGPSLHPRAGRALTGPLLSVKTPDRDWCWAGPASITRSSFKTDLKNLENSFAPPAAPCTCAQNRDIEQGCPSWRPDMRGSLAHEWWCNN